MCWLCDATNGILNGSLANSYTNTDGDWVKHICENVPWDSEPAFARLLFFVLLLFIAIDLMHIWHLGVGRDVCGSTLKYLILKPGYFAGRNHKEKLHSASKAVKEFAKERGLPLSAAGKKLTKAKLQWGGYPHLKLKAADVATYTQFLAHLSVTKSFGNDDLSTAVWAIDQAISVFMRGGMFLNAEQMDYARAMGLVFLRCWLKLAAVALRAKEKMYKVRPKIHLLQHCFLGHRRSCRNPGVDVVFMDEDWIKSMARLSKHTHKKTMALRTIQRYLAGLKQELRRFLKNRLLEHNKMDSGLLTYGSFSFVSLVEIGPGWAPHLSFGGLPGGLLENLGGILGEI